MAPNTSNDNFQHRPRQRNGPPPPRRQGRNPPPPSSSTRTSQNQPPQHTPQEKKKPVFVKVDQLKPGTSGHTLTVKVVDQNSVPQKPGASSSSHLRPARISECLVGDETACILFTARNDQGEIIRFCVLRFYFWIILSNSLNDPVEYLSLLESVFSSLNSW